MICLSEKHGSGTLGGAAAAYVAAGLCALPAIRAEKRPAVGQWKRYRGRLPTEAELSAWFDNGPDAVCIVCGEVSSNAEMIDFDAGGELYEAWCGRVPRDLLARLAVETTQRGGRHVVYRCEAPVCGNMKLAQRRDGDKTVTLIETRGEGGLFLCAPTEGYALTQGDLGALPVLTEAERDALLAAAWELNEYMPPLDGGDGSYCGHQVGAMARVKKGLAKPRRDERDCAARPGDDYNRRGEMRAVLTEAGWELARGGENEYWRRPGKASGWSASLKERVFYVFSANAAPFEPNRAYSPFSVYALLLHGGDFERAAGELRRSGYGGAPEGAGADISAIVEACRPAVTARAPDIPDPRPVDKALGLRSDQEGVLCGVKAPAQYPAPIRRVTYRDPKTDKRLCFLTNSMLISAIDVCRLYKMRWQVELFFKWIKQHLRIKRFLGTSQNAVHVQIWIAIAT